MKPSGREREKEGGAGKKKKRVEGKGEIIEAKRKKRGGKEEKRGGRIRERKKWNRQVEICTTARVAIISLLPSNPVTVFLHARTT